VIGVVTSPTGAVIRDILHRLRDRFPSHVVVWPVLVQGPGAAAQIAAAVRGFSALEPDGPVPRPDLMIVARGGGSIEDLWCFNDEDVVRAIAASTIPTISAVGHETDTTLADFAADVRAPTPTAAAEMAVPVRGELLAGLADLQARKQRATVRLLSLSRERLEQRARRLPAPPALLEGQAQRLDELGDRLRRALVHRTGLAATLLAQRSAGLRPAALTSRLQQARERLAAQRLRPAVVLQRIEAARTQVGALNRLRRSLDPEAPLARGYVLVKAADGSLIRSRDAAAEEALLQLKFADGVLEVAPGAAPAPSRPAPKPRSPAPGDAQPKLL
jgi:exodeoxyribonuclease VII large subunit